MSFAHLSVFWLIYKSSLHIKDIISGWNFQKLDSEIDSHAGVYPLGSRPKREWKKKKAGLGRRPHSADPHGELWSWGASHRSVLRQEDQVFILLYWPVIGWELSPGSGDDHAKWLPAAEDTCRRGAQLWAVRHLHSQQLGRPQYCRWDLGDAPQHPLQISLTIVYAVGVFPTLSFVCWLVHSYCLLVLLSF